MEFLLSEQIGSHLGLPEKKHATQCNTECAAELTQLVQYNRGECIPVMALISMVLSVMSYDRIRVRLRNCNRARSV